MIESIVSYVNSISGGNQFVSGVLVASISGTALYAAKEIPRLIGELIKKQFTTTMTFNNTDWEKNQTFIELNKFIKSKTSESGSRTVSVDTYWCEDDRCSKMVLSLGYGIHMFFYDKKLMWVNKTKIESSGSERQKEETSISYLGRSHSVFEKLISENIKEKDGGTITISEWKDNQWREFAQQEKRGLDKLALNENIKNQFTKEIEYFMKNEHSYRKLGLNYKTTFLLHGKPGTGKTSIVRAVASDYDMNVCVININGMTDNSFTDALNSVKRNSIILIEDFDSASSVKNRGANKSAGDDLSEVMSTLTLTGILNALDGVCSLDGCMVFMTTNVLHDIDPAVYRSGRVDHLIELPDVDKDSVRNYFVSLYGDDVLRFNQWKDMKACEINDIVFKSKDNVEKCIDNLSGKFG